MPNFISSNPVIEQQDKAQQRALQLLPVASGLEQHAYARNREETDRAQLMEGTRIMAERAAPPDVQASTPPAAPAPAAAPAQQPRVDRYGAGEFGQQQAPATAAAPQPQANPLAAVRANADAQGDRLRRATTVGPAAARVYGPQLAQHEAKQSEAMSKHSDQVLAKLGDGDIEGARQYAQVHGLRHLDGLFANQQALITVGSVAKTARQLGLKDTHASSFVSTVMEQMKNGASYDQALTMAHQKIGQLADQEPSGAPIATTGGYMERTKGGKARYITDPDGKVAMPGERVLTHRPPSTAAAAGGGSRATAHAEAKKKALVGIGWSEKDATEAAYGTGGKQVTERDVIGVAKSLWATDQKQLLAKQRKFASYEDALKAARGAMGAQGGGAPGPQPAAAVVDAPRDPKMRKVNETYKTPKGNLKWMGDGWEAPSAPAQ